MAKPKLFNSRVEAMIAAENESMSRGYSDEDAKKYSATFQVRPFGAKSDSWESWFIHHIATGNGNRKVYRRPIMESEE